MSFLSPGSKDPSVDCCRGLVGPVPQVGLVPGLHALPLAAGGEVRPSRLLCKSP